MSYIADEVLITKGVQGGAGPAEDLVTQEAIGAGNNLLDGSVAVDGVVHVGDELFEKGEATVMIAEEYNSDAAIDAIPTSQDVEDGNNPKQSPTNLSLKVG